MRTRSSRGGVRRTGRDHDASATAMNQPAGRGRAAGCGEPITGKRNPGCAAPAEGPQRTGKAPLPALQMDCRDPLTAGLLSLTMSGTSRLSPFSLCRQRGFVSANVHRAESPRARWRHARQDVTRQESAMWLLGFSEAVSSARRWPCRVPGPGLRTQAACPDPVAQPPSHREPARLQGVNEGLLQSGVHQVFIHASDVPGAPHSRGFVRGGRPVPGVSAGPTVRGGTYRPPAGRAAPTCPGRRDPPAPHRTSSL
jgi:hypothetical protein